MEFINKLDINGVITLLAVIAYVVVFVIKKSEIEKYKSVLTKQETISKSMETFMNIFKVDEVIKYNNMREETTEINIKNYLNNNQNLNKLINESTKNLENKFRNEFDKEVHDRYEELFLFSVKVLNNSDKKTKEIFYESLTKNRENIEKFIYDLNKNNL